MYILFNLKDISHFLDIHFYSNNLFEKSQNQKQKICFLTLVKKKCTLKLWTAFDLYLIWYTRVCLNIV